MKSISKLSLIFLSMALCFSPKSYANQAEEVNGKTTSSDLKTGENIILTEPDTDVDNVIKDLNESTEGNQDKVEAGEKTSGESKDDPGKKVDKSSTNSVTTSKPLKNPSSTENSKESKENSTSSTLDISPNPNNISKQTSSNKDVDQLMAEIKTFLKKNKEREQSRKNSADSSKKNDDITKTVEKVSDVVVSKKISKEESEKIAKTTKDIVKEYNKKIEAAKSDARKQELAQEAIDKINKNVKMASKEAYDYINKEDDEVTLFDQKNETLVLEIDAPGSDEDDKNSNDEAKDLDEKDLIRSESSSLSRSPKLSNKKDSKKSTLPIILGIILVIGISVALSLALKVRENKKIRSKN